MSEYMSEYRREGGKEYTQSRLEDELVTEEDMSSMARGEHGCEAWRAVRGVGQAHTQVKVDKLTEKLSIIEALLVALAERQ